MAADQQNPDDVQANVAKLLGRLRGIAGKSSQGGEATRDPYLPQPSLSAPSYPPLSGEGALSPDPYATYGESPPDANAPHLEAEQAPGQSATYPPLAAEQRPGIEAGTIQPPLPGMEGRFGAVSHSTGNRKWLRWLVLGGVLLGGGWLLWHFGGGGDGPLPTVIAETTPEKVKPTDEGGIVVPNQDVEVLETMNGAQGQKKTETVLPPPEQPVTPPVPAAPSASAEAPSTSAAPVAAGPEVTEVAPAPALKTPGATMPQAGAQNMSNQVQSSADQTKPAAVTQTAEASASAQVASAAPASAQSGAARIQLAAVTSEEAARREWAKLQKAHPDTLGKLALNIEKADKGAQGIFYRIQAGPFADRATAKAACDALKRENQQCIVTH